MNEGGTVTAIDVASTSGLARDVLDEVNRAFVGKREQAFKVMELHADARAQ